MPTVLLASCERPPVTPEDDPLLAEALRRRARYSVSLVPWTAVEPSRLAPGSAVVLRSTWDYHRHAEHFLNWLAALETAGITVLNAPVLIRRTIDKSYLAEERPFGCTAPETLRLPADADLIIREARNRNWKRFILKPPISASADGTFLLDTDNRFAVENALHGQPDRVLVQEFLPGIREGELSLIFIGSRLSHTVRKTPAAEDFRVQEEFGSRTELVQPPEQAVASARRALQALPEVPCYARVDGIMRDNNFVLMEMELIEPDLFLRYRPVAVEALAEEILNRL